MDKLWIKMTEETRLGNSLWPEAAVNCEHVMLCISYHGCYEFVHTSGILASKTFQLHCTELEFLRKIAVVIFRNCVNIRNLQYEAKNQSL
jgi:hypothetical protein